MAASPSAAAIANTSLDVGQAFFQNGPTSTTPTGASIYLGLAVQSPSDFTSASVSYPGPGSPETLSYNPQVTSNGTYATITGHTFPDLASLNAAYPFGTYSFTATNSRTGQSQNASLVYDYNHRPSATPMLSAASYQGLQGVDASQPYRLSFNAFTGDGVPCCIGEVDPATSIAIYEVTSPTTYSEIYASAALPDTTTSFLLPADTLSSGHFYFFNLQFSNALHSGNGATGYYYLGFQEHTSGYFTTAIGASGPHTLVNFEGGTPSNPRPLPIVGQIGDVSGSIGGQGSSDFYELYWSGGALQTSTSLTGANPRGSYLYELLGLGGHVLASETLDQSDAFSGTLNDVLPAGFYEVGLDANSPFDPAYVIHFATPVEGVLAAPEPGAWALLLAGACAVGASLRGRRRRRLGHERRRPV
jgi:hypothetical protein